MPDVVGDPVTELVTVWLLVNVALGVTTWEGDRVWLLVELWLVD